MANKNKKTIQSPNVESIVSAIGTTAMLAATVFGVTEHMHKEGNHHAVATQPGHVSMSQTVAADSFDVQFRRSGKEEIHHGGATYGAVKRSASVSGAV